MPRLGLHLAHRRGNGDRCGFRRAGVERQRRVLLEVELQRLGAFLGSEACGDQKRDCLKPTSERLRSPIEYCTRMSATYVQQASQLTKFAQPPLCLPEPTLIVVNGSARANLRRGWDSPG